MALALFWSLASAAPAFADYRDDYCQGLDAARRNRWADVAQRMRAAIAARPQEGGLVRCTYLNQSAYVPHFYLGRALKEQGNCAGAVSEWGISEAQGVIQSLGNEYRILTDGKQGCGPAAPPPVATRPPPTTTAPPSTTTTVPVAAPPPVAPPPVTQPSGASPLVPQANSEVARPAAPPPVVERAPTPAASAAKPTGPVRPAVPPALRRAAQAYFDGDYRNTLSLLTSVNTFEPPMRAEAYLFIGAAKYALFQIDGGRTQSVQREAQAAIRASRQADPSLSPEPRYFSPGFIQFFRDAR